MKTIVPNPETAPASTPHSLTGLPRIAFFALGTLTSLGAIVIALAFGGADPDYGIIWMGLILGVPMLILGFLAQPETLSRSPEARAMVFRCLAFAIAAVGGIVIHNLGSAVAGEESLLAGISFFIAIIGIPVFLITALIAIPLCAADQWLRAHHR